ncbi:monofunctional biosynthetic peptidoglycan transglycosylase [Methylobacillus arboreus]|uniref:monofunctional biosynthetic peptidoglycan transglycosylase n=1 Tax=Methylobacillus arboreus TaxID=755170 RepID=UPI001E2959B2|nr:monofunctional biosynthetic peptidoglycan transglycosylase [Methylobacillus arboreus]MCB5190656.1 monofunctional biosynthetic peptidoglycan transglycosylase [Methylobacillus arboreus]
MIKRLIWRGLLLALVLVVFYQLWIFMHILWWVEHNPASSAFMRTSLITLREENPKAALKHEWVEYSRISRNLKRAVIASEDAKFVGHEGFDWDGIQKAYEKNWQKGKIVAGGSTISQQLAKNLFLSTKRTPWRKLQEAAITWMLERMMSKRRILEIYLNVIEWGSGVFGAEAAARHYYKTSAANLSSAQAAKLAAMIPNPRYYDKHREARGLVRKAAIIESRMRHAAVP